MSHRACSLMLLMATLVLLVFCDNGATLKERAMYKISDHYNGRNFYNPGPKHKQNFFDFIKWITNRSARPWECKPVVQAPCPTPRVSDGKIVVTYVNHMTFLIQVDGFNILTDPVWSERVSPFSWIGPKRKSPVGLAMKDLPPIDVILLSHNHYDHLDIDSLRTLCKNHDPAIVTPLGNGRYLKSLKSKKIKELDWWDQETPHEGLKITAVPARHFSGRGLFDRDKALWCGFVIEVGDRKIYFAGDTAWGQHFNEIALRFPCIQVALLPAGAYLPFWFMSPIHLRPSQTIDAFVTLGAQKGIACHMGTFPMGDDSPQEAIEELKIAMSSCCVSQERFIIPHNGDTVRI